MLRSVSATPSPGAGAGCVCGGVPAQVAQREGNPPSAPRSRPGILSGAARAGRPASCSLLCDTLGDELWWKLQHLHLTHEPGHGLRGRRGSAEKDARGLVPASLPLAPAREPGVPFPPLRSRAVHLPLGGEQSPLLAPGTSLGAARGEFSWAADSPLFLELSEGGRGCCGF